MCLNFRFGGRLLPPFTPQMQVTAGTCADSQTFFGRTKSRVFAELSGFTLAPQPNRKLREETGGHPVKFGLEKVSDRRGL